MHAVHTLRNRKYLTCARNEPIALLEITISHWPCSNQFQHWVTYFDQLNVILYFQWDSSVIAYKISQLVDQFLILNPSTATVISTD